jgi:hypothetical protein
MSDKPNVDSPEFRAQIEAYLQEQAKARAMIPPTDRRITLPGGGPPATSSDRLIIATLQERLRQTEETIQTLQRGMQQLRDQNFQLRQTYERPAEVATTAGPAVYSQVTIQVNGEVVYSIKTWQRNVIEVLERARDMGAYRNEDPIIVVMVPWNSKAPDRSVEDPQPTRFIDFGDPADGYPPIEQRYLGSAQSESGLAETLKAENKAFMDRVPIQAARPMQAMPPEVLKEKRDPRRDANPKAYQGDDTIPSPPEPEINF